MRSNSRNWLFLSCAISIALLVLPLPARAGDRVGNGGYGLLMDGKPYVLDLVEAGVEAAPFFDPDVRPEPALLERLKAYLPQLPETHERLAQKLSELERIAPTVAWSIVESFRLLNISVVNETLVDIGDIEDSVVDYDPASLIQLAIRRGAAIYLNGTWWPRLDVDQKVALLVHESVYAFQKTKMINLLMGHDANGTPVFIQVPGQQSGPARAITGFLFSEKLRSKGEDGLKTLMFKESRLYELLGLKGRIVKTDRTPVGTEFYTDRGILLRHSAEGNDLGAVTRDTSSFMIAKICYWAYRLGYTYTSYFGAAVRLEDDINTGLEAELDPRHHGDDYPSCLKTLTDYRRTLR